MTPHWTAPIRPGRIVNGLVLVIALLSLAEVVQGAPLAVSREFSIFGNTGSAYLITSAASREFSIFGNTGSAYLITSAASREFSTFGDTGSAYLIKGAASREFSILNDSNPPVTYTHAASRELGLFNNTTNLVAITRGQSREMAAFNQICTPCLVPSSDDPAFAYEVSGTLTEQLTTLNSGPPPFSPGTWSVVARRNDDAAPALFECQAVVDPLGRPYLAADQYVEARDEVTLDNCHSAFYRYTFELPTPSTSPVLVGKVNLDDQGVVFLNGHRISGLMTVPGCEPTAGPGDPCYALQDAGKDRSDAFGSLILAAPRLDTFATADSTFFIPGVNELVFAVAGDAGPYEPTGLEFYAQVAFRSSATGVGEVASVAKSMSLGVPFPNPSNAGFSFRVVLPMPAGVRVDLFDVAGRLVRNLVDQNMEGGDHLVRADQVANGEALPGGIYFLRMAAGKEVLTRRIVVVQ